MSTAQVLREIRRASTPYGVAVGADVELTQRQLQWACHNGLIVRRYPNVFIDPAVPAGPLQELQAAVAAARGPIKGAWGRSSAALFGLIDEHPSRPEICVPVQYYARIPGVVVRRSSDLCFAHLMTRHHIRTTKPLIAALDLGVVLPAMDLAEVYVRANQMKLFTIDGVRATLQRLARRGRNGIRTSRDALDLVMINGRPADSVLELRFHHGPGMWLPEYEYQHPVTFEGKNYRLDFAYPEVKVGIEVDGYEKRTSMESLTHDARKTTALMKAGWTVPHFTWPDVKDNPQKVVTDVLALLRDAGYRFRR